MKYQHHLLIEKDLEIFVTNPDYYDLCNASLFLKTNLGNQVSCNLVVANKKSDANFLPFQVIYNEKFYAIKKIPGSVNRSEGRPSDSAIINGRSVDRSIRPFICDDIRNEIQLFINILASAQNQNFDILTVLGASLVLQMAGFDLPPISAVTLFLDKNTTKWTLTSENALAKILVVGTIDKIVMLEVDADLVDKDVLKKGILAAKQILQKICEFQTQIITKLQANKKVAKFFYASKTNHLIGLEDVTKTKIINASNLFFANKTFSLEKYMIYPKIKREAYFESCFVNQLSTFEFPTNDSDEKEKITHNLEVEIKQQLDVKIKAFFREMVILHGKRFGNRELTEIRSLKIDADIIPSTFGSGFFARGLTKVMSILTFDSLEKILPLHNINKEINERFFLHYNFSGECTGEPKRSGARSRREIGHGHLAQRAVLPVLPSQNAFPVAIRMVSEVTSSDGSTSQGAVTSSIIALLNAGIQIKKTIAGIAMGLVYENAKKYEILTDIESYEDFYGDMDFKIAGTSLAVTAIQLDTKLKGISYPIIFATIDQGLTATGKIAAKIDEFFAKNPQKQKKIEICAKVLDIKPSEFGLVFGAGKKNLLGWQNQFPGTYISTEMFDGKEKMVIFSPNNDGCNQIIKEIKKITWKPNIGDIYQAIITKVTDNGVELSVNGAKSFAFFPKDAQQQKITNFQLNQQVKVKIIKINPSGIRCILLKH